MPRDTQKAKPAAAAAIDIKPIHTRTHKNMHHKDENRTTQKHGRRLSIAAPSSSEANLDAKRKKEKKRGEGIPPSPVRLAPVRLGYRCICLLFFPTSLGSLRSLAAAAYHWSWSGVDRSRGCTSRVSFYFTVQRNPYETVGWRFTRASHCRLLINLHLN